MIKEIKINNFIIDLNSDLRLPFKAEIKIHKRSIKDFFGAQKALIKICAHNLSFPECSHLAIIAANNFLKFEFIQVGESNSFTLPARF